MNRRVDPPPASAAPPPPANRVSVLINNFNNAPFLRPCLDSVLTQSRAADEIVVYDDGSTDDSLRILREYGSTITVLSGRRGEHSAWVNQGHAIEEALRASTGDLVFLLDSDDMFERDKIRRYVDEFARAESIIVVQGPMWKIDEQGATIGVEHDARRHASRYLEYIRSTNDLNIYYPTSSLAFRRSYLLRRFPLDHDDGLRIWPDGRLVLVAPHFGEIATVDRPYTFWRRHARSHTVVRKTSVYEQFRVNREYYNAFCRRHGLPPINPWKSPQHRKRWLKHLVPEALLQMYQRRPWRPPPPRAPWE